MVDSRGVEAGLRGSPWGCWAVVGVEAGLDLDEECQGCTLAQTCPRFLVCKMGTTSAGWVCSNCSVNPGVEFTRL